MLRARFDETNRKFQQYQAEFNIPILPSQQRENINTQALFKLYPDLIPLSDAKLHQKQAYNPEKIRLYIESLQKQNNEINTELKQQANDIVCLVQMVNTLIDENTSLSRLLEEKDIEMHSLVETVTINETEEITDLKHQLRLLEDENFVLTKHVQEQRDELYIKNQELEQQDKQLTNLKQYSQQLEQQIEDYKKKETIQSEENQILKDKLRNQIEKNNEQIFAIKQKDNLIQSLNSLIEKNNRKIEQLTDDFEKLEYDKIELQKNSSQKIYELNQLLDDLENELSKQRISNDQYINEINNYYNELKENKQTCDHLADQNDEIMKKLTLEIEKSRKLQLNEISLQEQIGMLNLQNIEYYNTLKQQSQQLNLLIDQNQNDLSIQKMKYDEYISKLKTEIQNENNQKNQQIEALENENQKFQKTINQQNTQIEELNTNNELIKKEIIDYQQQKRIIEQQQLAIRQLKLQLEENKLLLQEFVSHKGGVQADIDERDKKIQQIINQKDERIAEIEKEKQIYQDQCNFLQLHSKNNEHLEQQNYNYRQQIDIFEQEIIRYKQDIEKLQNQINNYNTIQKQQKIKADQIILDENQQLRKRCGDLENELSKLKDQQMNTLPIPPKQLSEQGSRIRYNAPSQDFQQTKQNQPYLQQQQPVPQIIQPVSPHHSAHSPTYSRRNIQESDDGSVKGATDVKDKKMQYSFADEQQKLQQQKQIQRQKEREGSYNSSMSNAPYRKKSVIQQ